MGIGLLAITVQNSSHPTIEISWRRLRIVLLGGLVLGTTDLTFAMSFWGIGYGVSPVRVLQSVARGVLGTASFEGGAASALLGGALHYVIAVSMVLVYFLASRRIPALTRRPVAFGLAYGMVLYLVMNLVVLPLSAVGMPRFDNTLWVVSSVVMHGVFGLICSATARAGCMLPPRP